jgi:hypothetical protein
MSKSKTLSHSYGQETWNFLREVEREVRKNHSLSTQTVLSGELRYVRATPKTFRRELPPREMGDGGS